MEKFKVKLKSIKWFFSAIAVLLMVGCNGQSQQSESSKSIKDINVAEFKAGLSQENAIVIDVRTPQETKEGIIEGAKLININDSGFEDNIARLDTHQVVYVYCRSGARSSRAAKMLSNAGFDQVYNLNGGILSWQNEGEPTVNP